MNGYIVFLDVGWINRCNVFIDGKLDVQVYQWMNGCMVG